MSEWNVPLGSLTESVLAKLSVLLDSSNSLHGWRRLAEIAGTEKQFKCSNEELETCSLMVLEPGGSPSRYLLHLLSERACSLHFLLCCLDRMGHTDAVRLLQDIVQEGIRIVLQPEPYVTLEGRKFSLNCRATGPPGLSYQWFCGKQELSHATSPELVFDPVTRQSSGWYICRVHHGTKFIFSRWAQLQVMRATTINSVSDRFSSTADGLCILRQPKTCVLVVGDSLELSCVAVANPPPQYQWFRNEILIPGAKSSCLQVSRVMSADRGRYRCKVYNLFREAWSMEAQVEIGRRHFTLGSSRREVMADGVYTVFTPTVLKLPELDTALQPHPTWEDERMTPPTPNHNVYFTLPHHTVVLHGAHGSILSEKAVGLDWPGRQQRAGGWFNFFNATVFHFGSNMQGYFCAHLAQWKGKQEYDGAVRDAIILLGVYLRKVCFEVNVTKTTSWHYFSIIYKLLAVCWLYIMICFGYVSV